MAIQNKLIDLLENYSVDNAEYKEELKTQRYKNIRLSPFFDRCSDWLISILFVGSLASRELILERKTEVERQLQLRENGQQQEQQQHLSPTVRPYLSDIPTSTSSYSMNDFSHNNNSTFSQSNKTTFAVSPVNSFGRNNTEYDDTNYGGGSSSYNNNNMNSHNSFTPFPSSSPQPNMYQSPGKLLYFDSFLHI